jgi:hypothetical protein
MPSGFSGSYGVNGVALTLQPTSGQWEAKSPLGFDGNGHPIYPPMGEFTLSWGLISTGELAQLINFYESVSNTGTVVTELPKWGDSNYLFYSYSGTIIQRPTVGEYFQGWVSDVKMIVSRIRV